MSRLSLYRTGWEKGLRARRKRVMKAKGKIGEGGGYKLWAGPSSVCVCLGRSRLFVCLVGRVTGVGSGDKSHSPFPEGNSLFPAKRIIGQLEINFVRLSTTLNFLWARH